MRNMRHNEGFTLIELLVVVAIISLLASLTLGALNTARNKGQIAAMQVSINQIRNDAELIYSAQENYRNPYTICDKATVGAFVAKYMDPGQEVGDVCEAALDSGSEYWRVAGTFQGGRVVCVIGFDDLSPSVSFDGC